MVLFVSQREKDVRERLRLFRHLLRLMSVLLLRLFFGLFSVSTIEKTVRLIPVDWRLLGLFLKELKDLNLHIRLLLLIFLLFEKLLHEWRVIYLSSFLTLLNDPETVILQRNINIDRLRIELVGCIVFIELDGQLVGGERDTFVIRDVIDERQVDLIQSKLKR